MDAVKKERYYNFYPRPPRGGRHAGWFAKIKEETISIHVPRVGDDYTLPL